MTIRFECTCGQRVKARDSSAGQWVRCPRCQAELAVPAWGDSGGQPSPAGGAEPGSAVQAALQWQDRRAGRRSRPAPTGAERWLMEHGLWVPLGVALMALFGAVGLVAYAAGLPNLARFGAFMLLVGLGSFLYGRFELKQLAGVKDEEDRPGAGP